MLVTRPVGTRCNSSVDHVFDFSSDRKVFHCDVLICTATADLHCDRESDTLARRCRHVKSYPWLSTQLLRLNKEVHLHARQKGPQEEH